MTAGVFFLEAVTAMGPKVDHVLTARERMRRKNSAGG